MVRAERTGGIGRARISGEQKGLAAAAAPIDLAAFARATGFAHPARAAIALERLGAFPDLADRAIPNVFEAKIADCRGSRTGKHVTVGCDGHELVGPTVHARLWKLAEIIRKDVDDLHRAAQTLARCGDDLFGAVNLRARRHQGRAIVIGPPVELDVREL